jgi:hypothetical protein
MGGAFDQIEAKTIAELKEKTREWEKRARAQGLEVVNGWDRKSVQQTESGYRIGVHAHT